MPVPHWVKVEQITIPEDQVNKAAKVLSAQLGPIGIELVGGEKWWQWRRDGSLLQGDWVEMRRDYTARKQNAVKSNRIMLYIHGGAYFFGSVDEHRYQLQRHARKLEARVFAPRYRLAPQYPFPCGLFDSLAAYLYLLTIHSPSEIVMAGDSAGAGMIVSILVTLRDQSLPLPAGAILISPWVDLTHSFPSVAGDNIYDYIPSHGFMHRPSLCWPPMVEDTSEATRAAEDDHEDGSGPSKSLDIDKMAQRKNNDVGKVSTRSRSKDISLAIDGKNLVIKDQIQMYTTNQLLSHPLVSPVLQPSLGGLPPLLVMTGGGEVLRDEQIYLAHKAANPHKYPPGATVLDQLPDGRSSISKFKATDVQLQVWDDLCHVAPALSFTKPAKYMYRSIAQFGAWALARAQKTEIEIQDDDDVSIISSNSDSDNDLKPTSPSKAPSDIGIANGTLNQKVGKAGEPLPSFKSHMIRQRVDRKGNIFSLGPATSLPALQVPSDEIGVPKPGPVKSWLEAKRQWDEKYARERRKIQKQRTIEKAKGYETFGRDEHPPPSALAGRRGASMPKEAKTKRSWGMSLWSVWGSTHDENTIQREEKADREVETTAGVGNVDGTGSAQAKADAVRSPSRPKSRRRTVTYSGQDADENTPAYIIAQKKEDHEMLPAIRTVPDPTPGPKGNDRPSVSGQAVPFKLAPHLRGNEANASTITLMSQGIATPKGDEQGKQLGESPASGIKPEDRRPTLEDKDGVLHKALPSKSHSTTQEEHIQPVESLRDPDKVSENVPAAEERRTTMEDQEGVLHKAISSKVQPFRNVEQEAVPKVQADAPRSTKDVPAKEERRSTMEDQDGVIHKGIVQGQASTPSAESTPKVTAMDTGDNEDIEGITRGDRRMTLEGSDGVIHKAPLQQKEKPERPVIERFETASESL